MTSRYLPARLTGSEVYMLNISENLALKGHDINVLTSDICCNRDLFFPFKNDLLSHNPQVVNGIGVIRFKSYPCLPFFLSERLLNKLALRKNTVYDFIYNYCFGPITFGMHRFIVDHAKDYDLIHATAFPQTPFYIAFKASQKAKIPYVCTPAFHFEVPSFYNKFLIDLLRKSDAVIAATITEKLKIVDLGVNPAKIYIVPKGVNPEEWKRASGERFRKKYGLQDAPIVLFAGTKSEEKGVFQVLHAMKYVQNEVRGATLVTIGEETVKWKNEKSKRHIRLLDLPYVSHCDKMDAFDACAVFVMPSKVDSFGIAYLEAWICGKPVIGARIGSTPDVIRDGVDGLLVDFNDAGDLARKILFLLKDPMLRQTFGVAGRERTLKDFTWKRVAEHIDEIYTNVTASFQYFK